MSGTAEGGEVLIDILGFQVAVNTLAGEGSDAVAWLAVGTEAFSILN